MVLAQVPFAQYQSAAPGLNASVHDPNLISPLTGDDLFFSSSRSLMTCDGKEHYAIEDGILRLFKETGESADDAVTRNVQEFYEATPFPNYSEFDSLESFLARGSKECSCIC